MTATIVARVSDAELPSWLVAQRNDATVRNPYIASVMMGGVSPLSAVDFCKKSIVAATSTLLVNTRLRLRSPEVNLERFKAGCRLKMEF